MLHESSCKLKHKGTYCQSKKKAANNCDTWSMDRKWVRAVFGPFRINVRHSLLWISSWFSPMEIRTWEATLAVIPHTFSTVSLLSHFPRTWVWKCFGLFFHLMILWTRVRKSKGERFFFNSELETQTQRHRIPSFPQIHPLSYVELSMQMED